MNPSQKLAALNNILGRIVESQVLPDDCYLAGGTTAYIYFHHRLSIDLDFFSPQPFNSNSIIVKFRENFEQVDIELIEKDTVTIFFSSEKLKFSLFYFPYKLLLPVTTFNLEGGLSVNLASLDDLEAMKGLALAQRGSAKDFIDLFYLLKESSHSFSDLSRLVRLKFGVDEKYDYNLKTAMVYFDDAEAELESIIMIDKSGEFRPITEKEWQDIKDFFIEFSR
jgi:predicted nucleotidyltransferase component of viral defense system